MLFKKIPIIFRKDITKQSIAKRISRLMIELNKVGLINFYPKSQQIGKSCYSFNDIKTLKTNEKVKIKPIEYTSGVIYLLKSNGLHKIGFTTNMDSRLKSHLTSNPTIQLVSQFNGTLKDEKELHAFFDNKRVGGEWFELSIEDLNYTKKYFNENFK
jgi:hypothetical protein